LLLSTTNNDTPTEETIVSPTEDIVLLEDLHRDCVVPVDKFNPYSPSSHDSRNDEQERGLASYVCSDQAYKDISREQISCLVNSKSNCPCHFRVLLDSGANNHMLPHEALFSNLITTNKGGKIRLGDMNLQLPIIGAGTTHIPLITHALYVPKLSQGLLSVGLLDKEG
jgi:hypothetical protein